MAALSLLLHSTGTTPALWAGVPDDVVQETVRLAPAHLGYPPHAPLPRLQACDAAREASHVQAAIPADASELHLYAHSYGAVVAIALLPLLGDRVRSLFLYEPVLFGALARDTLADPAAIEDANTFLAHPWFLHDDTRGGTDPWLEMFIDYWNRPGAFASMPGAMRAFTRSMGWKMYQEVRACFLTFASFELPALRRISTTVAMGARSPRASRAMAQALARVNQGVRLVELAGTGHMAPLTHAPLVHAAMREHVAWRQSHSGTAADSF